MASPVSVMGCSTDCARVRASRALKISWRWRTPPHTRDAQLSSRCRLTSVEDLGATGASPGSLVIAAKGLSPTIGSFALLKRCVRSKRRFGCPKYRSSHSLATPLRGGLRLRCLAISTRHTDKNQRGGKALDDVLSQLKVWRAGGF